MTLRPSHVAAGLLLLVGCGSSHGSLKVTKICAADSYCCSTSWDRLCVGEVGTICGKSCGGSTCSHPICSTGGKLTSGCDPCATKVCAADSYCCSTSWDSICVGEVGSICGQSCTAN